MVMEEEDGELCRHGDDGCWPVDVDVEAPRRRLGEASRKVVSSCSWLSLPTQEDMLNPPTLRLLAVLLLECVLR